MDCSAGHQHSFSERVGWNKLAGQHGDGLQELRQPDRCRTAGSSDCGVFRPEGNARWAAGENPLSSILAALFLMSISATMQLLQGWNSGGEYATTDMLTSLWNYIAGQIMPAAAGLACVGAVINFVGTDRGPGWSSPRLPF
jgi:hypothetical protein